jgi:hypothetical protein
VDGDLAEKIQKTHSDAHLISGPLASSVRRDTSFTCLLSFAGGARLMMAAMPLTSLSIEDLEAAFARIKASNQRRANLLQARLADGQTISPEDEEWLDGAGNIMMVDESALIEHLRAADDLEAALLQLSDIQQEALSRLKAILAQCDKPMSTKHASNTGTSAKPVSERRPLDMPSPPCNEFYLISIARFLYAPYAP